MCTRQESNLRYKIRNLVSYPLNDGCDFKFRSLNFEVRIDVDFMFCR
jgi:hypothetical protein